MIPFNLIFAKYKHLFLILLGLFSLSACRFDSKPQTDLSQIQNRGTLRVGTLNNQISYFISPKGPTGLEYELTKSFANQLNVKLDIQAFNQASELFDALNNNQIDLIAAGLNQTSHRLKLYRAGPTYYQTSQVVVYRKGNFRPKSIKALNQYINHYPKTKFQVVAGSHAANTLAQIQKKHPNIKWQALNNTEPKQLLKKIERNQLDFTIVDSLDLSLNQRLYPHLSKAFYLKQKQPISWFIRKENSDNLYALMIEFFGDKNQSGELVNLKEKYFGHIRPFDYVNTRAFIRAIHKRLPKYAALFQQYSHQFDWKLIAALSYQESHWRPNATSPTGVRGLMMLTENTAKSLHVSDRLDPKASIQGGTRYLEKMLTLIPDSIPKHEKIWFALASYNLGFGHVMDARRLTRNEGKDPNAWADVKNTLPKLAQKRYHAQLHYGYARGEEAKSYVENIRQYYQTLTAYLQENELDGVSSTSNTSFETIEPSVLNQNNQEKVKRNEKTRPTNKEVSEEIAPQKQPKEKNQQQMSQNKTNPSTKETSQGVAPQKAEHPSPSLSNTPIFWD